MERSKSKPEQRKRPVNRRMFLGLLLGAAAAVAGVVSLDSILSKNAEPEASASTSAATPTPTMSALSPTVTETAWSSSTPVSSDTIVAQVVVVKGTANTDPQVLVDKALEALGGVENLVPAGTNILVKPNVGFYEPDATTDPRITAAVVKALKAVQPGQIVVGESSLRGVDTEYALQITGTKSLAEAAGAEVRDLTKDSVVTVTIPSGIAIKSVDVFKTATTRSS